MQIPWLSQESKLRHFPWLRAGIIISILLVSTQVYRIEAYIPIKYWIFLVGVVFLGVIALRNMTTALTIVLLTSATTGIVIGTGRSTPLPAGLLIVVFLCVIWFLKMLILDRRIYLKPSPLNIPIIGFLIVAIISWVVGYAIWDWRVPEPGDKLLVQLGQFTIYLFSFLVMFLTAHQSNSRTGFKIMDCDNNIYWFRKYLS